MHATLTPTDGLVSHDEMTAQYRTERFAELGFCDRDAALLGSLTSVRPDYAAHLLAQGCGHVTAFTILF